MKSIIIPSPQTPPNQIPRAREGHPARTKPLRTHPRDVTSLHARRKISQGSCRMNHQKRPVNNDLSSPLFIFEVKHFSRLKSCLFFPAFEWLPPLFGRRSIKKKDPALALTQLQGNGRGDEHRQTRTRPTHRTSSQPFIKLKKRERGKWEARERREEKME